MAGDLKKITYHLNVNLENNKNKIIDHLNFSLISKLKKFFTSYNPCLHLGNDPIVNLDDANRSAISIKQKLHLIQTNLDTFNRSITICLKVLLINRYLYQEIDEFFKSLNLMNGEQSELEIALMIESFFVHLEKKFNFIKSEIEIKINLKSLRNFNIINPSIFQSDNHLLNIFNCFDSMCKKNNFKFLNLTKNKSITNLQLNVVGALSMINHAKDEYRILEKNAWLDAHSRHNDIKILVDDLSSYEKSRVKKSKYWIAIMKIIIYPASILISCLFVCLFLMCFNKYFQTDIVSLVIPMLLFSSLSFMWCASNLKEYFCNNYEKCNLSTCSQIDLNGINSQLINDVRLIINDSFQEDGSHENKSRFNLKDSTYNLLRKIISN